MCSNADLSYLGGHAGVEGVLVLCCAHLLSPHHLSQTHVVVILEVTHTLAVHMGLNLQHRESERCDQMLLFTL